MIKYLTLFLSLVLSLICTGYSQSKTLDPRSSDPDKQTQTSSQTFEVTWFNAVKKNKVDEIERLLEKGYDIDGPCFFNMTALMQAVSRQHVQLVDVLLQKKANPSHVITGNNVYAGATPIFFAASTNSVVILEKLLSAGSSLTTMDKRGRTPFMWAVYAGKQQMGAYLLKKGSDINHQDKNGTTILMDMATLGDSNMVDWLLKNGADPHLKNNKGETALSKVKERLSPTNKHAIRFNPIESYLAIWGMLTGKTAPLPPVQPDKLDKTNKNNKGGLLSLPFNPLLDLVEYPQLWKNFQNDRLGSFTYPEEMEKEVREAKNFAQMDPVLKKWILDNKRSWFCMPVNIYCLYLDNEAGILIYLYKGDKSNTIFLGRFKYPFAEDAMWQYTPLDARKKQFTASSKTSFALKSYAGLSAEERSYIEDLLSVLNENYSYFANDIKVIPKYKSFADTVGKYYPMKLLVYDHFERFIHGEYSEQKREISSILGRPVYDFSQVFDGFGSNPLSWLGDCGINRGWQYATLIDGQEFFLTYSKGVGMKDVKDDSSPIGHICEHQQSKPRFYLSKMQNSLIQLMVDKGVDLATEKNNKTAFKKAMFDIWNQTEQKLPKLKDQFEKKNFNSLK